MEPEQVLRDRGGARLGSTRTNSDGKVYGYDRSGKCIGHFDPRTNATVDRGGKFVGTGNLLVFYLTKLA